MALSDVKSQREAIETIEAISVSDVPLCLGVLKHRASLARRAITKTNNLR